MEKKLKVIFDNGEDRLIGTADNQEEAYKIINDFLDQHNYKSYYWRISPYEDYTWIDVGSHTEFFKICD